MMTQILAAAALAVWLYLVFARGGFWRCGERDDWPSVRMDHSPPVAIVVPARNEADQIGASIVSLVDQDYAGPFTVILVDDASTDGTAGVARGALPPRCKDRLRVVSGRALPNGWTGKLWAVKQGIDAAMTLPEPPQYLLLTDADIVHPSDSLTRLVMHAHANRLVLASLMVEIALRELRRARVHSGVRLLLPDALSVRLGEPRRAARSRPPPAAACWCALMLSKTQAASTRSAAR